MPSRAVRQARARIDDTVKHLKLALFGLTSPTAMASLEQHGVLQESRYGPLGLRYVPAARMPEAVDAIFASLNLQAGQRLVEIGPGPHAGIGLIAALMGLRVVMVEYDQPFLIDIDLLRQQLQAFGGLEADLAKLATLSGSIAVSQLDNLKKVLSPQRSLIAAAGGSIEIVPGDFADAGVQQAVMERGPFEHIICTDVINPMKGSLASTTAATTTGDDEKIRCMLEGLARIAAGAKTLYTGVVIPEENPEFRNDIENMYRVLEQALENQGRSIRYQRVICPSSSTVLRARLYQL